MNCLLRLLHLVVKDANIEIGLEILWITCKSLLINFKALLGDILAMTQILDASGLTVEGIDILRIKLQNLAEDLICFLILLSIDHQFVSLIEKLLNLSFQVVEVLKVQTDLSRAARCRTRGSFI